MKKQKFYIPLKYALSLFKWLCISLVVALICGITGSLFHISIDKVTNIREKLPYVILFLPLGGLAIGGLYGIFKSFGKLDTNRVLDGATGKDNIPFVMAPLIFISTVITHFLGGSAGREGAALQLGGSIGGGVGKIFHLKKDDMKIVIMAGMSAVFSALFGTPVTAAVFAMEVACVGLMHYAAIVPCVFSACVASYIASLFGISPVKFSGIGMEITDVVSVLQIVLTSVICALGGILFCLSLKWTSKLFDKVFRHGYIKALAGSAVIILLTCLLGTRDYNGAGMNIIKDAMEGKVKYEAFIMKIIFTALTLSSGFKGGEIVPSFFIGSTLGCTIGHIFGFDPAFAAGLGFISVFCSVTNCPLASVILSVEVFGTKNIAAFAIVCAISFLMSGYTSLYKSQNFMFSKLEDKKFEI